MSRPTVSVIVPNYNHGRFLDQRLSSIFGQSFQDFELILLDDCSTDNSLEVFGRYADHPKVSQIVKNESNTGNTFVQWKKGISLAKGEWVWIAESDDFADSVFLEKMICQATNDQIGLVACESAIVDESGQQFSSTKQWNNRQADEYYTQLSGRQLCQNSLCYTNIFPNASAMLVRNCQLLSDTPFDQFRRIGDWLLWFRLMLDYDAVVLSEELNMFRKHGSNVTPQEKGFANIRTETVHVLLGFYKLLGERKLRTNQAIGSLINWTFKNTPWSKNIRIGANTFANFCRAFMGLHAKDSIGFAIGSLKFLLAHLLKKN